MTYDERNLAHSKYICDRLRAIQQLLILITVTLSAGLAIFICFAYLLFSE